MKGSEKMYDVIVIGAGPAGATVAKKCAEYGLKTLILEKRKLPREKVCSGMIMGQDAHSQIKQEFGDVPESVLTQPRSLSGYGFHVPAVGYEQIDNYTLLTWRRNLDYWMVQKARSCGAELIQGAVVKRIEEQDQKSSIIFGMGKKRVRLETRYLVGADGANSLVRKSLFPELRVRYSQVYQEHYQGETYLDKDYIHWFYPVELSPASFTVHQKDGLVILDAGGRPGQAKQIMSWARDFLGEKHGLDLELKPVWKGGCMEPALFRELTSRTFNPAKGNVILVGDAAGLIMPVSGEGIGLGMKSAILAAESIAEATLHHIQPDAVYLSKISDIIAAFEKIYPWFRKIMEEAKTGGHALPRIIRDAYERTLNTI